MQAREIAGPLAKNVAKKLEQIGENRRKVEEEKKTRQEEGEAQMKEWPRRGGRGRRG